MVIIIMMVLRGEFEHRWAGLKLIAHLCLDIVVLFKNAFLVVRLVRIRLSQLDA